MIRSRILKCQYRIDESVSPEAKDLIGRMLRLDPSERISVPEMFSHCWMRANTLSGDYQSSASSVCSGSGSGSSSNNSSTAATHAAGNSTTGRSSASSTTNGCGHTNTAVDGQNQASTKSNLSIACKDVEATPVVAQQPAQCQAEHEFDDGRSTWDSDENVLSSEASLNDDARSSSEERIQLLRKMSSCGSDGEPFADIEAEPVVKEPTSPTFKLLPLRRSSVAPSEASVRARPQTAQELSSPTTRLYHRKTLAVVVEQGRTLSKGNTSSEADLHQRMMDEMQKPRSSSLPPKPLHLGASGVGSQTLTHADQAERRRSRTNAFQSAGSSLFKRTQQLTAHPSCAHSPPARLSRAGSADVKRYVTPTKKDTM